MQTILPIFVIIVLGVFFYRIKLAKYSWVEVLNEFVVRIGFPSLIFSTLVKLEWNLQLHGQILLLNSAFVLFCFSLAYLVGKLLKFDKKLRRTLFLAATYGNIAYLGIPVIELFLGKSYLPEASLITACYLFWIFTVGMIYLEYSTDLFRAATAEQMLRHLRQVLRTFVAQPQMRFETLQLMGRQSLGDLTSELANHPAAWTS